MADDVDPQALNPMEQAAVRIAISSVTDPVRREALERQSVALRVRAREYTGAGFYTWFTCPESLHSDALPDEANRPPAAFSIYDPAREEGIHFLVYTKDGLIDVLEGASGGMWYEESASAGCWPGTMDPIIFDPALVELG